MHSDPSVLPPPAVSVIQDLPKVLHPGVLGLIQRHQGSCANSNRNCAKEIDEAITSGNDDLAADLLARQMITMLSGVRDEKRRQALTALAISKALAVLDDSQVLA